MANSLNVGRSEGGAELAAAAEIVSVVGIGLDGIVGLGASARQCLQAATAIAGSDAQLQLVADLPARKIALGSDLSVWLRAIQVAVPEGPVAVLASGDPLFYGIGRVLLEHFGRGAIAFYPHISCVQLAFARLGIPWQGATIVSVHGRGPDELETAIRQGKTPIAVLTDGDWTPAAVARLATALQPPISYRLWVCSALGAAAERIEEIDLAADPTAIQDRPFLTPNVAILQGETRPIAADRLPLFGIPDAEFFTFADRPSLLTKQEIRSLSLGLLQLQPEATVWDIGAGTGAVSIEIARLIPAGTVYAIERTAAGLALIAKNCDRFGAGNVEIVGGSAPAALAELPDPSRIVVGGGGARIGEILQACASRLHPGGILVAHFATLEACTIAHSLTASWGWEVRLLQANIARSSPLPTRTGTVATRFTPLNPVVLMQAIKPNGNA